MYKNCTFFVRGKIFEKNNMVSNDSKLPNSARNAKKKFFCWRRKTAADGGSGGPAAVFLIQIFFTYQPKKILFQYLQNHRRSTVFKIYLDIREFEKNLSGEKKNNMVLNDSKLPNSARNAKFFFCGGGKRWRAAGAAVPPPFFLKIPKLGVISDTIKKISSNYL